MHVSPQNDVYSAREIALAAGVAGSRCRRARRSPCSRAVRRRPSASARALTRRGRGDVRAVRTAGSRVVVPLAAFEHAPSRSDRRGHSRHILGQRSDGDHGRHRGPAGADAVGLPCRSRSWAAAAEVAGSRRKRRAPKALREGHGLLGSPLAALRSTTGDGRAPLDAEPLPVVVAPIVVGASRLAKSNRRPAGCDGARPRAVARAGAAAPAPEREPALAKATEAASGPARAVASVAGRIAREAASSRRGFFTKSRRTTRRTPAAAASSATSSWKSSCGATGRSVTSRCWKGSAAA